MNGQKSHFVARFLPYPNPLEPKRGHPKNFLLEGSSLRKRLFQPPRPNKGFLGHQRRNSFQSMFLSETEVGKSQVDLVIDRSDNIVDPRQIKCFRGDYQPTKESSESLWKREQLVYAKLSKKKIIKHVLITTFGIVRNKHSFAFSQVLVLDDLFK